MSEKFASSVPSAAQSYDQYLSECGAVEDDGEVILPKFAPFVAEGNSSEYLVYFKSGKRVVEHPTTVRRDDDQALVVSIDVESQGETEAFKVAVASVDLEVPQKKFFAIFKRNLVCRPVHCGVYRLCVCPRHGKVSVADPFRPLLVTQAPLVGSQLLQSDKSPYTEGADCEKWRILFEMDDAYIRVFHEERTANCLCHFRLRMPLMDPDV